MKHSPAADVPVPFVFHKTLVHTKSELTSGSIDANGVLQTVPGGNELLAGYTYAWDAGNRLTGSKKGTGPGLVHILYRDAQDS